MTTRSIQVSGPLKIAGVVMAGLAFATPHLMITAFYGWMFLGSELSSILETLGLGG